MRVRLFVLCGEDVQIRWGGQEDGELKWRSAKSLCGESHKIKVSSGLVMTLSLPLWFYDVYAKRGHHLFKTYRI